MLFRVDQIWFAISSKCKQEEQNTRRNGWQPRKKSFFFSGVTQDTSPQEVKTYISQFGKVKRAAIVINKETKQHEGFGFVLFENKDVVDQVCQTYFHNIKNTSVETVVGYESHHLHESHHLQDSRESVLVFLDIQQKVNKILDYQES